MALKKWKKGSYTIEAAVILPIVLIAIMQGLVFGINLCTEVKEDAKYNKELQKLQAVDIFQKTSNLEEFWRNLNEDGI